MTFFGPPQHPFPIRHFQNPHDPGLIRDVDQTGCLLGFALPILVLGVIRLVILLLTNPVLAFIGTAKIILYLINPIHGVFRLAKRCSNPLPRVLGYYFLIQIPSVLSVNNIIPLFRIRSNGLVPVVINHV